MKRYAGKNRLGAVLAAVAAAALFWGCSGDGVSGPAGPDGSRESNPLDPPSFRQVNLVSSSGAAGIGGQDPLLVNPWGIASGPEGELWVSSTGSRMSTSYSADGAKSRSIEIPASPSGVAAAPIGIVYNPTVDFIIPKRSFSRVIVANGTGTIAAWDYELGGTAEVVVNRNPEGAGYTGLTIGRRGDSNYLFVANFNQGTVEVFNREFTFAGSFRDPSMPTDYAPFNVKALDGLLYVAYARRGADGHELIGSGLGSIVVFNTNGRVVRRFATGGPLNAPWGIAQAPPNLGELAGKIFVGNFGDGRINIYNTNGEFAGALLDVNGAPVKIDGLWGLEFSAQNRLYFTAGPEQEQAGLFGYLAAL